MTADPAGRRLVRVPHVMEQGAASTKMLSLINGYLISQALHVAATLGLPDLLARGPLDAEALAIATSTKADPLNRLMRALAALGVFHEGEGGCFALTEFGSCLRSDSPESVGGLAAHVGLPYVWSTAGALLHSIQTGGSGFQHVHGTDSWSYREARPALGEIFDRAMAELSRRTAYGVAKAYPFSGFDCIIDVGGGHGALLAAILACNPSARGVLFDRPHVAGSSRPVLEAAGVADRCECINGSFFDSVPSGGDAYLLKSILHSWDDQNAITILKVCRGTLRPNARLLVVERILGQPVDDVEGRLSDLNMLLMRGRERTEQEFAGLFAASGLSLVRVIPGPFGFSILETKVC